mgnify:CR=1 FL=1
MINTNIEYRLSGIPCLIRIDDFENVPPWPGGPMTAPSDMDARGYIDCCYTILDRRGREAPWLERKITANIDRDIINTITEYMLT